MFPDGSFGSTTTEPIAWIPNEPDRNSQLGFPASAFFVRHTPPPATPSQSRQLPGLQVGAMASEVVRPPAVYSAGT